MTGQKKRASDITTLVMKPLKRVPVKNSSGWPSWGCRFAETRYWHPDKKAPRFRWVGNGAKTKKAYP